MLLQRTGFQAITVTSLLNEMTNILDEDEVGIYDGSFLDLQVHLPPSKSDLPQLARSENQIPLKIFQDRLPPEIQDIIWNFAIQDVGRRVMDIEFDYTGRRCTADITAPDGESTKLRCSPRGFIPSVLQICARSRELALRRWTLCAAEYYRNKPIYIDTQSDLLCLNMDVDRWSQINCDSGKTVKRPLRNICIEIGKGMCARQVGEMYYAEGEQMAKTLHERYAGVRKVLFAVEDMKQPLTGDGCPLDPVDKVPMHKFSLHDVPGWIYYGFCAWHALNSKTRPDVRFTNLSQSREEWSAICPEW